MTDLDGLEAVDWRKVEHAYGAALDTPAHLTALATGDAKTRKVALAQLASTIHHQTETYSASAAAVPFLVQLVRDPAFEDRLVVLQLVAALAVGDLEPALLHGFDVREPAARSALEARDGGRATYEAVGAALPPLLELLSDPDVTLHRALPIVASLFVDRASAIAPRLRVAMAEEQDAFARASCLLALGRLDALGAEDVANLDSTIARGGPADVESCAAAIARLARFGRDERALALLAKQKATKKSPGFFWGDLRELGQVVVDGLDLDRPAEQLVDELERGVPVERAQRLLERVLPRVLPLRRGSDLLPAELSEVGRRALVAAAKHGYIKNTAFGPIFAQRGIPPFTELGAWLGVSPPGLLERVATQGGRAWPIWKWLQAAVQGEIEAPLAVDVVSGALDAQERLALAYPEAGQLAVYRYDLNGNTDLHYQSKGGDEVGKDRGVQDLDDVFATLLATCPPGQLVALAEQVARGERKIVNIRALLCAIGRQCLAARRAYPETLRPLLFKERLGPPMRDAFASLPLEAREEFLRQGDFDYLPILTRSPEGPRPDVYLQRGWTVLDLCPTTWAVEYTVQAILQYKGPQAGLSRFGDILVRLGTVASPILDAALSKAKVDKNPAARQVLTVARDTIARRAQLH